MKLLLAILLLTLAASCHPQHRNEQTDSMYITSGPIKIIPYQQKRIEAAQIHIKGKVCYRTSINGGDTVSQAVKGMSFFLSSDGTLKIQLDSVITGKEGEKLLSEWQTHCSKWVDTAYYFTWSGDTMTYAGDSDTLNTVINQHIDPMILDGQLCKIVSLPHSEPFIDTVLTCDDYNSFKKEFPEFQIPKKITDHFKSKCK